MDDDLDAELLQMGRGGAGGAKRRRRAIGDDSDDDEGGAGAGPGAGLSDTDEDIDMGGGASSDDGEGEGAAGGTKRARPLKKRRAAGGDASDDESEGELPLLSEDEYDDEFFGDEDDRARLMAMNEFDREEELARRAELRQETRDTNNIRRQKNAARAARKAAKRPATKTRSRAAAPKKKTTARTALDGLVARKKAKERRQRDIDDELAGRERVDDDDFDDRGAQYESDEDYGVELSDEDEELIGAGARGGRARGEGGRRRRGGRRDSDDEPEEDSPPATIDDFRKIMLSRDKLAQWVDQPFFEEAVKNAMVRVHIGANQDGEHMYRLVQIADVVNREDEVGKQYAFGGRENRDKTTTLYLMVSMGENQRRMPMREVSNNLDILDTEFYFFTKFMGMANREITRRDVEKVQRQLDAARNYTFKAQDVKLMIEEKRAKGLVREGRAREKARLEKVRQLALADGDAEKAEETGAQLAALDERLWEERAEEMRKQKVSMSSINDRNKKWTVKQDQAGGALRKKLNPERSMVVQEGMEDAQDPFARRKTRPQRYFNVNRQRDGASDGENKGGASGDEADEADEEDAAAPEGGVDASFEALVSHVPNLKIDMGRLQMVANGNAQMGEQGSLAGFGHTLKHLPPRSNLMEVPTHVLTIEEYRSRHGI